MYDVAIIGGGPGGYVAAIRAAQLELKVVLIEKDKLGGICLNWGCIPTKSLLKSAEYFASLKHAADFGVILGSEPTFDINKMVARSRNISQSLSTGIKMLLSKNKIKVISGTASFNKNGQLIVNNDEIIKAKNTIIATGARAKTLPGFDFSDANIWSAKEAMIPNTLPKSLIIIGSGAIGIEFASFYNMLGSDVSIIESASTILPREDKDISNLAAKIFKNRGMKLYTDAKINKYNKTDTSVKLSVKGEDITLKAEKILMAVGIAGNIENFGLEEAGITTDKGQIITDKFMQTNKPGVYAIGDVTGAPWLAHKASHEGIIAAEHIAGLKPHTIDVNNIPACTYSSPQMASVGMTEAAALAAGLEINIGKFPFMANGKALTIGESEGFVKTIFDSTTGELLGAHMIGAEVTELIQGYVIAKTLESTENELMQTIFAHPTLSEMMHEAVLEAYKKPIHI